MKDDNENTQATWLGINTIQVEVDPDQYKPLFGSQQPNFLSQNQLYESPAVIDALNILLKSISKNTLDEFDVNVYRAATRLIKADEICHYLNIAPSSLSNLAQKSGEIEKISLPENSNEAKNKYNQQEDLAKLQKAVEEHPIILEREKALTLKKDAEDQKQNQEKTVEEHKANEQERDKAFTLRKNEKDLEDSRNDQFKNENKNKNINENRIDFFDNNRKPTTANEADSTTKSPNYQQIIPHN